MDRWTVLSRVEIYYLKRNSGTSISVRDLPRDLGKGLFAEALFEPGQVIFSEKPLVCFPRLFDEESQVGSADSTCLLCDGSLRSALVSSTTIVLLLSTIILSSYRRGYRLTAVSRPNLFPNRRTPLPVRA